jgi:peptidylprolyl isomerase
MARVACLCAFGVAILSEPMPAVAQLQPAAPPPVKVAPPTAAKPKAAPRMPVAQVAAAPAPLAPAPSAAPAPAPLKSPSEIVARVGGADLTADDLRAYVAALGPREQAAVAKDPALLSQAVRLLLANRLVLQEALAKKWDQQPNVAAQLQRARENALAELYLQSVATPPASFPTDEDVQKAYDANRTAFLMPRQFQLAQIFVAAPKDGDKAVEDKAKKSLEDIQQKLKAPGADFAALASAANDSRDGGELGWVVEDQIRPEIRTQVMGLARNAISEPIRLDDGWHILKLIDTKAAYTRTLPEVREQLVQQMRTERATALRRGYLADLLKQHPPVLNELALSTLLDQPQK